MADASPRLVLRPLERRLLALLAAGRTQAEVAAELHYSGGYVREVLTACRARSGARTTAQLISQATRAGLL